MNLKELIMARLSGNGASLPGDDQAARDWPLLYELLTCRVVLDNQRKRPARLSIQVGVGEWVVGISDEDLAMSLETSAETLAAAFQAAEMALASGRGWKQWSKRDPRLELPGKKKKTRG